MPTQILNLSLSRLSIYFHLLVCLTLSLSLILLLLLGSKGIRHRARWVRGVGGELTKNYQHNWISIQIFKAGLRKSKSLRSGVFITSPAFQPYAHLQQTAASSFGGLSPLSWWSQEKTPFSPGCCLFVG